MTGNGVVGEVKPGGGERLGPALLQPPLSSTLSIQAGGLIH